MSIGIVPLLVLLFGHFFSDFVRQTDEMAKGKSKSNRWLLAHIRSYSTWMIFPAAFAFGYENGLSYHWVWPAVLFIFVNAVFHFFTDWCTSRLSSRMWENKEVHNFFVVIGFDQFIHAMTLILTFALFNQWAILLT